MIELSAVKKAFNQGRPNEYWALHGIDLAIEAGRVTALRGPSGSGSSANDSAGAGWSCSQITACSNAGWLVTVAPMIL